jgi:hypothetical protein
MAGRLPVDDDDLVAAAGKALGDHGAGDAGSDHQDVACKASGDGANVRSTARDPRGRRTPEVTVIDVVVVGKNLKASSRPSADASAS